MNHLIGIDEQACTQCGACTSICPSGYLIALDDGTPAENAASAFPCLQCGHCEAVCPSGAITARYPGEYPHGLDMEAAPITPEQLKRTLSMRRSTRRFKREPVDRAIIEDMLDTVRFAPTGTNRQPLKWIIVSDPAKIRELSGAVAGWMRMAVEQAQDSPYAGFFRTLVQAHDAGQDPISRGAPHLAIAIGDATVPSAFVDGIIALSWLEITLAANNLGGCWFGFFKLAEAFPPLQQALALPEGYNLGYVMGFGKKAVKHLRAPKRKPLDVEWR